MSINDSDNSDRSEASATAQGSDFSPDAEPPLIGVGMKSFQIIADSVSTEGGDLVERVSALIDQAQSFTAAQVNATLTLRNWYIGRMIDVAVLHEDRAGHNQEVVASLGRQVSWTHFKTLLPVSSSEARAFYVKETIERRLGVRDLRRAIDRKAFERREIADSQIPEGSAVPLDAFRDPMLLDMLGLADTFLERDLEAALRRDMESFLLEVGRGWAFVERQKRMTFDGDDYYLDLLFYSRPLRRLIAVELKVGKFKPSYQGQMNFYLKWLDRHERQADENPPIGLILCTEASRDQIELLEMHDAPCSCPVSSPPSSLVECASQMIMTNSSARRRRNRSSSVISRRVENTCFANLRSVIS